MILDKHWWWTNDRESIVPDGHPDAAFLAFAKGHELADNLARKYGILREEDTAEADPGESEPPKTGDDAAPQAKTKAAPANKARAKTADKASE